MDELQPTPTSGAILVGGRLFINRCSFRTERKGGSNGEE